MEEKPQQDKKGRFLPGNSGFGGRPKGSRNKLGEAFLEDMLASWEASGPAAIQKVITERPQDYLKVVASLMPKEMNVNVNQLDNMSDDQLVERIRKLDSAIRPFLDAQGKGGDSAGDRAPTEH